MKKLARKLAITLGVVLGVIVIVAVGLSLFFPAEKVKDLAVTKASERLGREVAVADVGLSFAGGLGVELQGVIVENPAGFAGDPLLMARNIDLKLQIAPLLKGEFRINRLVVDGPQASLVRLSDGSDNFTFDNLQQGTDPQATSGSGTEADRSEMAVSFDRLQIRGGQLAFRDESTGQAVALTGLDLSAGLTNPQPGEFRSNGFLKVGNLAVTGDQPLPDLAAEVDYELSFVTVNRILDLTKGDLEINGIPLQVSGNLTAAPDSLRGLGQVKAAGIGLTDLFTFLTPEQLAPLEPFTLGGEVSLVADLDFDATREEPLVYQGQAKVAGFEAVSREVTGELRVQEIRLDFRPDVLEVASEGGAFAGQPLAVKLTVEDFQDPRLEGSLTGTFDLAFAEPFLPPGREADLAGSCNLESRFSGRVENIEEMDYAGRAVFQDVSYRDPALPDALEKLNGTVRFDPDSVVVEAAEARFGAGDLSLTGTLVGHLPYFLPAHKDNRDALPKPTLSFAARSRHIDIDKLFPAAAPGAGTSVGKIGTVSDTLPAEAIPDMVCEGTILADTLIYSRVPFTGVKGEIRLRDRILECYDVTGGVYGGQVGGQVSIDLNDLNDPAYSGVFEAAEIEANNFVTRFVDLSQVIYGKAGIKGSFQARGRDPEKIKSTLTMDSQAALTSGKVVTGEFVASSLGSLAAMAGQNLEKEQTLKDLTTLIKVENGRVGLDRFKTKLGSFGDLSLGGSYGFAGDLDYSGTILLTKEQTASLYASGGLAGSVARMFGDQAERLSLPLTVGGTMTRPTMNIDTTELTNNLKSQLQEELTDDLKDEVGNKLKGLFGK